MLKSRLLSNLYNILPCNVQQVSREWSAFTGRSHGHGLAWNVRVNYPDIKGAPEGFDEWVSTNADMLEYEFGDHCQLAYDTFVNRMVELFPLDKLEFSLEGRSGGWLVLKSWTRSYLESGSGFDKKFDFEADGIAESINSMSRNDLVRFRKIIRAINSECSVESLKAINEWIAEWYLELYQDSLATE